MFAILFSVILIMMAGLAPSGIMNMIFKILGNIYTYDKTGFLAVCVIVFLMLIILFNCLKVVQNVYTFERNMPVYKFEKRTTLNYVVPLIVIIFLILNLIL